MFPDSCPRAVKDNCRSPKTWKRPGFSPRLFLVILRVFFSSHFAPHSAVLVSHEHSRNSPGIPQRSFLPCTRRGDLKFGQSSQQQRRGFLLCHLMRHYCNEHYICTGILTYLPCQASSRRGLYVSIANSLCPLLYSYTTMFFQTLALVR